MLRRFRFNQFVLRYGKHDRLRAIFCERAQQNSTLVQARHGPSVGSTSQPTCRQVRVSCFIVSQFAWNCQKDLACKRTKQVQSIEKGLQVLPMCRKYWFWRFWSIFCVWVACVQARLRLGLVLSRAFLHLGKGSEAVKPTACGERSERWWNFYTLIRLKSFYFHDSHGLRIFLTWVVRESVQCKSCKQNPKDEN